MLGFQRFPYDQYFGALTRGGMDKRLTALRTKLAKTHREEEVKAAWAKHLDLDYDTTDDHDLYCPQVLFEFKSDCKLSNVAQLARVVAQVMYYLHRLKYGQTGKGIPADWCIADRNEVVLGKTADWRDLYSDDGTRFDWDRAPSSPDPALVAEVRGHPAFKALRIDNLDVDAEFEHAAAQLRARFAVQGALAFGDKKLITEDNFEEVYAYWSEVFGESVRNGFKPSRYFVNDIQAGRTQLIRDQGKVYFKIDSDNVREKKILGIDYDRFWDLYEKVDKPEIVRGILAKIDRLTDDVDRRRHGEFFTPLPFAHKALDTLEKTLGKGWWTSGEYRLWDMAAGTGNLQYHLPAGAWPYLYLTTLYKEDVEHLKKLFPTDAHIFQYDYLNDDIGNVFAGDDDLQGGAGFAGQGGFAFNADATWKLPEPLRRDLANPHLKWIVLINPPFATAQKGGAKGANKADVARTKVRERMHGHDLGEVSRELFAQFLYRIRREFRGRQAWLGLFSKLKYINATNDQKFRDRVFRYGFERGFMFSSVNFDGTSKASQFPVGFLLWNLDQPQALEGQAIVLDVYDTKAQKIGHKTIASVHRDRFLSKWIERPDGIAVFPPFSSAITVKTAGPDIRDRISAGFLGSLMCAGNDIQHKAMTALLSGPYASAGGHSITPDNFEQALVVHAVRLLPKAAWHNDRDQYMRPNAPLDDAFVADCVVWGLFANSNQTVAMRDVGYEGTTYQVPNHFFPLPLAEIRRWLLGDAEIALQLPTADERFVARWLAGRNLSPEAQALFAAGREAYRLFYAQMAHLRTDKFRIETWDVGWWQVRNALEDRDLGEAELAAVKGAHKALREKLLPQLTTYGFLAAGVTEV